MLEWKSSPNFDKSCHKVTQKVYIKNMFFKPPQKSLNIWATTSQIFFTKYFQKFAQSGHHGHYQMGRRMLEWHLASE